MNPKPLCIASIIVLAITDAALAGGALSAGQAAGIALASGPLAAWSFTMTDWWDGPTKMSLPVRAHQARDEKQKSTLEL